MRIGDMPGTFGHDDRAAQQTERHAALGPLAPLRRSATSEQSSVAGPHHTEGAARVSLFGFASDISLDDPSLSTSVPIRPYRITGHVGYSLDGGRTIFGFGPSVGQDIPPDEVLYRLSLRETFPGMVTDDTDVFREVARMPRHPASLSREPQIVYQQDIPMSEMQFNAIRAEHDARPLGEPLPDNMRYGLPFPNSPAFNCATYPSTLGIPIPARRGLLATFIPKLAEKSVKWRPDE